MHPILVKLGPVTLYSYGVMLVLAFVTASWLAVRVTRELPAAQRAIPPERIVDFFSLALVGGLLGARFLYVALYWEVIAAAPLEVVAIWHGGLVWYGGLLRGIVAGVFYARAHRLDGLRVFDQCIPFLVLGHGIGRVGCLLNGCCYSKLAAVPTQPLEALGLLLLYGVLRFLQRPALLQYPGRLFGGYLVGYAVLRFFLEFLRGDQVAWWLGLTLQQVISIGMLLAGVILWRRRTPSRSS